MLEKMILEFQIHPEKRAEFVDMCTNILPDTRAYDGNRSTLMWLPEDSDSVVWIYEEWDTRAQQEKYFSWRIETGLVDAISSFLTAPPRTIWLDQR